MLDLREVDQLQLSALASLHTPEENAEGPRQSVSTVTRLWTVPVLREILSISRRRRRRRSLLALERSVTTSAWIMEDVRFFTQVIWCQVVIKIILYYINENVILISHHEIPNMFGSGPAREGYTSGACFPSGFDGACLATPPECSHCNEVLNCTPV